MKIRTKFFGKFHKILDRNYRNFVEISPVSAIEGKRVARLLFLKCSFQIWGTNSAQRAISASTIHHFPAKI
jgi:hypothetical protein